MGLTLDPETRYELGQLRISTDKAINAIYRRRGLNIATAMDPEVVYLLDVLDACIELTTTEEAS